jgi:hypothetical protein
VTAAPAARIARDVPTTETQTPTGLDGVPTGAPTTGAVARRTRRRAASAARPECVAGARLPHEMIARMIPLAGDLVSDLPASEQAASPGCSLVASPEPVMTAATARRTAVGRRPAASLVVDLASTRATMDLRPAVMLVLAGTGVQPSSPVNRTGAAPPSPITDAILRLHRGVSLGLAGVLVMMGVPTTAVASTTRAGTGAAVPLGCPMPGAMVVAEPVASLNRAREDSAAAALRGRAVATAVGIAGMVTTAAPRVGTAVRLTADPAPGAAVEGPTTASTAALAVDATSATTATGVAETGPRVTASGTTTAERVLPGVRRSAPLLIGAGASVARPCRSSEPEAVAADIRRYRFGP